MRRPFVGVVCVALLSLGALAAHAAGKTPTTTAPAPLPGKLRARLFQLVTTRKDALLDKVRAAFARCLRKPEHLTLQFDHASKAQLLAGRFPSIRLQVRRGYIRQLRVHQGDMIIRNAILDYGALLDKGRLVFRDPGTTEFFLHLTQADINEMWRRRSGKIRVHAPRMELHEGWVRLHGQSKALLIKSPVLIRGRLAPHGSGKIYFHPKTMRLGFLPLPGFALRKIARSINPIASFLDFDIPLAPTLLETVRGRLFLGTKGFRTRMEEAVRTHGKRGRPGKNRNRKKGRG